MRLIVYAFIFAVVFLIFKAFFLDKYIAEHYGDDANSTETNVTIAPQSPMYGPETPAQNVSGMAPIKKEIQRSPEEKKMPLDKLGDDISKHIKL